MIPRAAANGVGRESDCVIESKAGRDAFFFGVAAGGEPHPNTATALRDQLWLGWPCAGLVRPGMTSARRSSADKSISLVANSTTLLCYSLFPCATPPVLPSLRAYNTISPLPRVCPSHLPPPDAPGVSAQPMARPRKDVKFQHQQRSASNGRVRRPSQSASEYENEPGSPTTKGEVTPPVRCPSGTEHVSPKLTAPDHRTATERI